MMSQPFAAVVMGASAGALEALSKLLSPLPENYPLPILVVVHVPPDNKSIIPELLQAKCRVKVQEAVDKEGIKKGTVYFAPPDYHLLVEADRRLSLSSEEPVLFSRPSINTLFETAADAYGAQLLGVILTGANNDGAEGLKAIIAAGGCGLVQNPELAYASSLPHAALELCPEAQVLSLEQIASYLQQAASLP